MKTNAGIGSALIVLVVMGAVPSVAADEPNECAILNDECSIWVGVQCMEELGDRCVEAVLFVCDGAMKCQSEDGQCYSAGKNTVWVDHEVWVAYETHPGAGIAADLINHDLGRVEVQAQTEDSWEYNLVGTLSGCSLIPP